MGPGHAAPQAHGTNAVNPILPIKHRICIQLIDDEGKLLKGIEVRLEHAGRQLTQTTDQKGQILLTHVRGVPFKILEVDGEPFYEMVKHDVRPILPPKRQ
jgi:hypothetical protein